MTKGGEEKRYYSPIGYCRVNTRTINIREVYFQGTYLVIPVFFGSSVTPTLLVQYRKVYHHLVLCDFCAYSTHGVVVGQQDNNNIPVPVLCSSVTYVHV